MSDELEVLPDDAQKVHTTTIPVRWGDLDAAAHVNNSTFFTYFEEARVNWLSDALEGPLFAESGPVLANATCDFKEPLTYPASLTVEVYAQSPGRSSVKTVYVARLKESRDLVAIGTAVLVWVSIETGETVAVPNLGLS